MQVRLLGPVDLVVDGAPRPVPGLRRKAVLAVLALQRGEVVSTDRLVDAVWAGGPPPTALNTLQSHVSYLRGVLGSKAAIVARRPATSSTSAVRAPTCGRRAAAAGRVRERPTRSRGTAPAGRARAVARAAAAGAGRPALAGRAGRPPGPAVARRSSGP